MKALYVGLLVALAFVVGVLATNSFAMGGMMGSMGMDGMFEQCQQMMEQHHST